jgi:uncharacterized membrane protein
VIFAMALVLNRSTSRFSVLTLLLSGLVFLGLGLGSARAEYSFCNKSSYAVSAAIGYVDQSRLITRGWWRLRAGECKVVMTDAIQPGRYFVYAEAIPGHLGALKAWSGDRPLCVENESLFTLYDQNVCATDPRRQREFFSVDVPESTNGSWRTEFVEPNNFTVYQAEVAGVQRLLRDIGRENVVIDGTVGRATQLVVREYRRSKGLGDSGVIDNALIDALIKDANERDAKLGFFFCNATQLPVWAAFAEPDPEEGYRSTGWWRLAGSECVKVRRGALASNHYFVYGVMEADGRDAPMVGGSQGFCISNVQFDAAGEIDCQAEGYDEAQFRRVEIGGEKSFTYKFTPDQFNPETVLGPAPDDGATESADPPAEESSEGE